MIITTMIISRVVLSTGRLVACGVPEVAGWLTGGEDDGCVQTPQSLVQLRHDSPESHLLLPQETPDGQAPQSAAHFVQSSLESHVWSPHMAFTGGTGHALQSLAQVAHDSFAALHTPSPQVLVVEQAPQSLAHVAQFSVDALHFESPHVVKTGQALQSCEHVAQFSAMPQ